jgi:hypothetical protein
MYPFFRCADDFFNSWNQFLSDIHLPTRLDADARVGGRFTYDLAGHRDMTLADNGKGTR